MALQALRTLLFQMGVTPPHRRASITGTGTWPTCPRPRGIWTCRRARSSTAWSHPRLPPRTTWRRHAAVTANSHMHSHTHPHPVATVTRAWRSHRARTLWRRWCAATTATPPSSCSSCRRCWTRGSRTLWRKSPTSTGKCRAATHSSSPTGWRRCCPCPPRRNNSCSSAAARSNACALPSRCSCSPSSATRVPCSRGQASNCACLSVYPSTPRPVTATKRKLDAGYVVFLLSLVSFTSNLSLLQFQKPLQGSGQHTGARHRSSGNSGANTAPKPGVSSSHFVTKVWGETQQRQKQPHEHAYMPLEVASGANDLFFLFCFLKKRLYFDVAVLLIYCYYLNELMWAILCI